MKGFITERDLSQADQEFPGIAMFFDSLSEKPPTFLDLLSAFEHWVGRGAGVVRNSRTERDGRVG